MKEPETTEYKGHPVLSLPMGQNGDKAFSFGLKKAEAILQWIAAIQTFVEKEGEN